MSKIVKCKYCGARTKWRVTNPNQKWIMVEIQRTTIVDDHGRVHDGHVPHIINCADHPDNKKKS